jgi:hypothetical protein
MSHELATYEKFLKDRNAQKKRLTRLESDYQNYINQWTAGGKAGKKDGVDMQFHVDKINNCRKELESMLHHEAYAKWYLGNLDSKLSPEQLKKIIGQIDFNDISTVSDMESAVKAAWEKNKTSG